MPLSWNEIKDRAVNFSKEWENASKEDADAKPFLDHFFEVFGISRRKVASFEYKVKKLDDSDGYIDMLWKATILIEMKSRGKNLEKAYSQAREYLQGLPQHELPKYILICDFQNFQLFDLEDDTKIEFQLNELVFKVQHFGYLLGYQKKVYKEQDPANIEAAELMGKIHDRLKEIGYTGHPLELYLVRLLFCLFAEDTTLFNKDQFLDYILHRTSEDGSDLAAKLSELFQVLNRPKENRFKNLDEQLAEFPYINGKLFEEMLPTASFDRKMRQALLECCALNWAKISPAIFGSMFQSVMNPKERRNLGAHYTSEKNILKLIKPLFLDELWTEFESVKDNKSKLQEFHKKISKLKFLDPACGCGNFLVITYRELRLLEIEILRNLYKTGQGILDIREIVWLDVDMFFGIELEEFPARIAEVAMWLIDHQLNLLVSAEFGQYFSRLPLKKAANITHGNALQIDWESIVPKNELSYILGNPPFVGSRMMDLEQKKDLLSVFLNRKDIREIDYVTGWYYKASEYIKNTQIVAALVSTNSICQGLHVGIFWNILINEQNIKIHFAHRTFKWSNEARGNAAVYCVIIGFANFDVESKKIYDYEDIKGEPQEIRVKKINPYLVEGENVLILKRTNPICEVPKMKFGNMPADGGNFLFTKEEKENFLKEEPNAEKYFKRFISAFEFINNKERWCLWLVDIDPSELRNLKHIKQRVENVKKIREVSARPHLAKIPHLFAQITQPKSDYLLIPRTTSENRKYIPIGFFSKDNIISDTCQSVPDATIFHFGVLTSIMHMTWVKYVCGRLKSDYRYSKDIVYNNFPWPKQPSEKQVEAIETAAQKVLDARAEYPNSSLADLYDPLTMPPNLVKAHNDLDRAVDLSYRPQPFPSESKRMEFLFDLYEQYLSVLFAKKKKR